MECVLPYDPFELYLIYHAKPGMSWFHRQRVFDELRDVVQTSLNPRRNYFQEGMNIHFVFYLNPDAKWLSRHQATKVRTIPFSSLLQIGEYILDKTLYESNYYVRDITAEKKYDKLPRIEMRYEAYGTKSFKTKK